MLPGEEKDIQLKVEGIGETQPNKSRIRGFPEDDGKKGDEKYQEVDGGLEPVEEPSVADKFHEVKLLVELGTGLHGRDEPVLGLERTDCRRTTERLCEAGKRKCESVKSEENIEMAVFFGVYSVSIPAAVKIQFVLVLSGGKYSSGDAFYVC